MLISILTVFIFTSCDIVSFILGDETDGSCQHEWAAANCKDPKTCTKCGETVGEKTTVHDYAEATCTTAKTCKICGIWEGFIPGHKYTPATCEAPKTCTVCGYENGDPVHDYAAATCTTPLTCKKCSATSGNALGHTTETVVTEATCSADGSEREYCTVCEATVSITAIPKLNHSDISFVYNADTTATTDGTATAACPYCDYSVTKTLVGSAALVSEAFAGKKISILGDSISTYQNYSSGVAADTTNSTIRNNIVWKGYNSNNSTYGGSSVDSTWWMRTINAIGADLLVNNANSGESVFNAMKDRCTQLHDDTGDNAGETPDIIFVYLGTNDNMRVMGNASSLTMADIKTKADSPNYEANNLAMAYAVMLYRIQEAYPDAEIYCLTNLERSDMDVSFTRATSQVIRDVVALFDGVHLVDICTETEVNRDNPDYVTYMPKDPDNGKSLHPGVEGMKEIARVLLTALVENSRYMSEDFDELIPENSAQEGA